jgi:hypothetical protein
VFGLLLFAIAEIPLFVFVLVFIPGYSNMPGPVLLGLRASVGLLAFLILAPFSLFMSLGDSLLYRPIMA